MKCSRTVVPVVALLLGFSTAGLAQEFEGYVTAEARGGLTVPMGELSDLADPGPGFAGAVSYHFSPWVAVQAVGGVDLFPGKDVTAQGFPEQTPDIELWHVGGGLVGTYGPEQSPWSVSVNGTVLATSFETATFDELVFDPDTGDPIGDFSENYVTVAGGLRIAYDVTSRIAAFVHGEYRILLADEADTEVFELLSPEVTAFDTESTLPLTAGASVRLF